MGKTVKTFSDEARELQDKNLAENIATAKLIICANIKHDAMRGECRTNFICMVDGPNSRLTERVVVTAVNQIMDENPGFFRCDGRSLEWDRT